MILKNVTGGRWKSRRELDRFCSYINYYRVLCNNDWFCGVVGVSSRNVNNKPSANPVG